MSQSIPKHEMVLVLDAVCKVYQVTRAQIMGRRRPEMLAEARQVGMCMMRRRGYTQEEVGKAFKRIHETVCHSEKVCRQKYSWDKKFMARWDAVRSIIDGTDTMPWSKVKISMEAEIPGYENLEDVDALSKATKLAVAGSSRVRNLEVTAA